MKPAPRLRRAIREALDDALTPHDVTPALAATLAVAIADYRVWHRRESEQRRRRDTVRTFAVALRARLADVERVIGTAPGVHDDRTAGGRRVVSAGLSPESRFLIACTTKLRPLVREWITASRREEARQAPERNRATNEARLRLACAVADALDRAGIRPTTTRSGVFVRVLHEVVLPATSSTDANAHRTARAALDALPGWRALPLHRRRVHQVPEVTP